MKRLKNHLRLLLLLSFCLDGILGYASTIDQSFTSGTNEGANINECCAFIGQTYTAGVSGTLAGVSVDINEFVGHNLPLDVQIRVVSGGVPAYPIIGEATTTGFRLSDVIPFSQVIPQIAGTQYAIVVHFIGAPLEGGGQGVGVWS